MTSWLWLVTISRKKLILKSSKQSKLRSLRFLEPFTRRKQNQRTEFRNGSRFRGWTGPGREHKRRRRLSSTQTSSRLRTTRTTWVKTLSRCSSTRVLHYTNFLISRPKETMLRYQRTIELPPQMGLLELYATQHSQHGASLSSRSRSWRTARSHSVFNVWIPSAIVLSLPRMSSSFWMMAPNGSPSIRGTTFREMCSDWKSIETRAPFRCLWIKRELALFISIKAWLLWSLTRPLTLRTLWSW